MIYGVDYEKSSMGSEPERCGNCEKACEELIELKNGWNFKACPECAEWCYAVEVAEPCPVLHREVVTANSVEEVREALRIHFDTECIHCGSSRETVMEDQYVHGSGEVAFCQSTSIAEVA